MTAAKLCSLILLLALSACAGHQYAAGNLGECYVDLQIDFCVVNADKNKQAIVNGTSLMAGVAGAVGTAANVRNVLAK